jgi:Protein of unknown function (DUF3102)
MAKRLKPDCGGDVTPLGPIARQRKARELRLDELAQRIVEELDHVKNSARRTLEHALAAGDLLTDANAKTKHGEWETWVREECGIPERTASMYMKLARGRKAIEAEIGNVADLSIRGALRLLAPPAKPRAASAERRSSKTGEGQHAAAAELEVGADGFEPRSRGSMEIKSAGPESTRRDESDGAVEVEPTMKPAAPKLEVEVADAALEPEAAGPPFHNIHETIALLANASAAREVVNAVPSDRWGLFVRDVHRAGRFLAELEKEIDYRAHVEQERKKFGAVS